MSSLAARDRVASNPLVAAALGGAGAKAARAVAETRKRVETLQADALAMDAILHDPKSARFVAVCAPTALSLDETSRLVSALDEAGVRCDRCVVNAVLGESDAALEAYAASSTNTQRAAIEDLRSIADEFGLGVAIAPQFAADLDGPAGLDALGDALFAPL